MNERWMRIFHEAMVRFELAMIKFQERARNA